MATPITPATSRSAGDSRAPAMRHPRRIAATVPDAVYAALVAQSLEQGRSLSNLVAYLLEAAARVTAGP